MKTIARPAGNPGHHIMHLDWPGIWPGLSSNKNQISDYLMPMMILVLAALTIALQSYLVTNGQFGQKTSPTNLPTYIEIPFAQIGLK